MRDDNQVGEQAYISEADMIAFELSLLHADDLGAEQNTIRTHVEAMINEVRRLRIKAGEEDLSGVARWPVTEWDSAFVNIIVNAATPCVQFRQFITAIAEQRTSHPVWAKVYDELGLRPFEMDMYLKKLRDAGVDVQWAHRPSGSG